MKILSWFYLFILLLMPRLALARCDGGLCTSCTNCSRCIHCKAGGTCSVCDPSLRRSIVSSPAPTTPQWVRPTARLVIPAPAPRRAVPEPRYFSEPNAAEPSWVRQQRLERSQGIKSDHNEPAIPVAFTAKCVLVADGDTLQVLRDGVAQNVRLNAIDAPELKQSFGPQAKNALAGLVLGQNLKIYPTKHDNNGRLWAWVFRGSLAINGVQVEKGYAWSLPQNKGGEAKITALQAKARTTKMGLWNEGKPLAPWAWREKRTAKS